jgi:molybdate transport system substrate-binding protein
MRQFARRLSLPALLPLIAAIALACGANADDGPDPAESLVTPAPGTVSVIEAEPGEAYAGRIRLAAASDLRDALEALRPALEETCQATITPVYGSSGQLKEQILAGAEFGLFLSADAGFPAELDDAGLVVSGGLAEYAVGRLALVTRDGIAPAASIDALIDPVYERVAIANPGHAPYGRAAEAALDSAGILHDIRGRLVFGENVRQAIDYVDTGNADAGIGALALVINADHVLIDAVLHPPITQTGAVVRETGAERTGRCILQYLLNPEGQQALQAFGFEAVAPQ